VDTSIKRIDTGMNKINEITTTVTALAYDIRKLTEDVKGIESK
jgi:outer membrane murein-binding lipoprotein Lpp